MLELSDKSWNLDSYMLENKEKELSIFLTG